MSKVKNLIAKMLQRRVKCNSSSSVGNNNNNHSDCMRYDSLEEIAQNQANERMQQEMSTHQLMFAWKPQTAVFIGMHSSSSSSSNINTGNTS